MKYFVLLLLSGCALIESSAGYEIDQVAENILQESSREGIEIPILPFPKKKDRW